MDKKKLLIIEDDRSLVESIRENLSDFDVEMAFTPAEGERQMQEKKPPVVLLDLGFPDDVNVGLALLTKLIQIDPRTKIIVSTGFSSASVGARAVERGAYAYIEKPIRDFQALRVILQQAFRIYELEGEIRHLKQDTGSFAGAVGVSPAIERVFRQIREVGATRATILLQGESGTGKEVIARALHEASLRKGPFVVLDCTAISENLVEDKLFGHEKGAFTGAATEVKGALETAHEGTLFIDEIGELPASLQPKFLRFLQEKTFQRLGSHQNTSVDVRVIAATHRDLKKEVASGKFREDFYWRLNVYSIELPPLRERREDIPLLVSYFLRKYSEEYGKKIARVAPAVLAKLSGYDWPGNVRELENLIHRAMLVASGSVLLPDHISPFEEDASAIGGRLSELEAHWKEHWIREALARHGGSLEKSADELGISKRQLQRHTKEFNIDWKKFIASLGALLFLFSSPSAFAKVLSLNETVSLALKARPELGIAGTRHEEAESYRLKARAASLPRLDLGVSYLRFDKQPSATLGSFRTDATIDMRPIKQEFPVLGAGPDEVKVPVSFDDTRVNLLGQNLFSTMVTLRQPLFAGGRIHEKKTQAKMGLRMADLENERVRRLVTAEVKQRFFRLLYAQKGSRLLSESAKRATVVEQFLKNLYENYIPKKEEGGGKGGIGREDWLKARVLASQIMAKRGEVLMQWEAAQKALQSYCGLEEGEWQADEKVSRIILPPLPEALQMIASLPEKELIEAQKELAHSEVRFAKGARYPELGAFGFFSYSADNFPSDPLRAGGGVMLKFPLFDGFEREAEIHRAEALYKKASYETDLFGTDSRVAVRSLYLSAEELGKRIEILRHAGEMAHERRELTSEGYLLDFGKYEDYLDALRSEVENEGLLLAAELEYWTEMSKLESLILVTTQTDS